MKDWVKALSTRRFGAGKHSQSYQDELLDVIFQHVGTCNATPFAVEFGFNTASLTEGSGSNVANLVLNRGWDSLLMDGGNANPDINLHQHFLTPSNICDLFAQHGVPSEPEYVSIDVDSTDLWLFEAVVQQYRARVFTVEYNAHYPLDAAITFPNDPAQHWQEDRGYGASLRALNLVAEANGYTLLWVVPFLDAFFVRNDLLDDGTGELALPFSAWAPHTGLKCHPPIEDPARLAMFVDYGVYQATGGDLPAAQRAAQPVCRRYLMDGPVRRSLTRVKRAAKRLVSTKAA